MRFLLLMLSMLLTSVIGSSIAAADESCGKFPQINRVIAEARGKQKLPEAKDVQTALDKTLADRNLDKDGLQSCLNAIHDSEGDNAVGTTAELFLAKYKRATGFQTLPYTVNTANPPANNVMTLPYTVNPNSPAPENNVLLGGTTVFQ